MLADCLRSYILHGTGLADVLVLQGPGGITAVLNAVPLDLISQYDIIGISGDDVRMHTPNWDRTVERRMVPGGLIYGRDLNQNEKLPTHPFISSRIINALGFVQPPALKHFYGDNFYQELLGPLGRVKYVPEIVNEHLHFTIGKSPNDSTYQQGYAHWDDDSRAWAHYQATRLEADRQRVQAAL